MEGIKKVLIATYLFVCGVVKPILQTFIIKFVSTMIDWWYWLKVRTHDAVQKGLIAYSPRYDYVAFANDQNVTVCIHTLSLMMQLTCAYVKMNLGVNKLRLLNAKVDVMINLDKKTATRCHVDTNKTVVDKLSFGKIDIDELLLWNDIEPSGMTSI